MSACMCVYVQRSVSPCVGGGIYTKIVIVQLGAGYLLSRGGITRDTQH